MLSLSAAAKLEAHKLISDGAWIVLFEIQIINGPTLFICRNNEKIIWNNEEWLPFPLEIDDVKESSNGELPSVVLRVSNVTRAVQGYIEDSGGGVGSYVIIRVVHSEHLDLIEPELEEEFMCVSTKCDAMWVYFELGLGEPVIKRFPPRRYLKNFCPFKFKGIECGVPSATVGSTCNKTLTACRGYNNSTRFGGFYAIPQGGFYV